MKEIKGKTFPSERALYALKDARVINCRFEGDEDGESALKECKDIAAIDCYMDLRYPLWHVHGLKVEGGEMTENCRAALWYCKDARIESCRMNGIKAVRECENVDIFGSKISSPEFGWQCKRVTLNDCEIDSVYAFLHSDGVTLKNTAFSGKYSFQYTRSVHIENSVLDTKDAFWHSKDVTVTDSEINGEYLGWYSEDLTLIRCRIKGTQPLCYCKNLKLIDCTMEGCDLSFEYSDVTARIKGHIDSVKNVASGIVRADSVGEIIATDDAVYPISGKILIGNTQGE